MTDTLREARRNLKAHFDAGKAATCPCCGQTVKRYPRKITSTMARQLARLYRAYPRSLTSTELQDNVDGGNRMYSMLRHWQMVEETELGWRITRRGINFVDGLISTPKFAFVYNNKLVGFSEERVRFEDCVDAHFDMAELRSPKTGRAA